MTRPLICKDRLSHQRHGVEDVDEEGEDLSVEVAGQDGAERGEDDHDGHADDQEAPGLLLHTSLRHHLPPVETWT